MSIVWEETRKNLWHARLLGKLLPRENSIQEDQGLLWGQQANSKSAIMAPPKTSMRKYKCTYHPSLGNCVVYTDSLLLHEPNQSVALATADCGATIIACEKTKLVALVHTGRDQLMCRDLPKETCSVAIATLETLLQEGADINSINVLNIGHIAPKHFPHRGKEDEAMLWQQSRIWGSEIIEDREQVTLCLHTLIAAQLFAAGLAKNKIRRVRIDPYTSPDLYSKRQAQKENLSEREQGSNAFILFKL